MPPPWQVNVRVSQEAYEGFTAYCAESGVSLTSYLEALGLCLLDHRKTKSTTAYRELTRLTGHARELDAAKALNSRQSAKGS